MSHPDRKEIARTISSDPSSYKICLVCGSIVDKDEETCPDCFAYRFDTDEEHVENAALDLAIRPQAAVSHLDLMPDVD